MPITTISADRISYASGYRQIMPEVKPVLKYGDEGPSGWRCRARQMKPRMDLVIPGKPVAIDCEGLILDDEVSVEKKGLGRVSVVEEGKGIIYDTFAYYPETGCENPDIKPENGARPIAEVIKNVQAIVEKAGIVVGHSFNNERHMLRGVKFEKVQIYDTQLHPEYIHHSLRGDPALADLSQVFLHQKIQQKGHSSVVDARATIKLYQIRRDDIERLQGPLPVLTAAAASSPTRSAAPTTNTMHLASATQASYGAPHEQNESIAPNGTSAKADHSSMLPRAHYYGKVRRPTLALASGSRVAMPAIPEFARGRTFDYANSVFV